MLIKLRSLFLMLVACHMVFASVAGTMMETALGVHDLVSHQHDEGPAHHHHLAITHLDQGHHEVAHHHGADNFQPNALANATIHFSSFCSGQSFCSVTDRFLPDIYPDGLLRPPRTFL